MTATGAVGRNWSGGVVPGSSDVVRIVTPGVAVVVDSSVTIKTLIVAKGAVGTEINIAAGATLGLSNGGVEIFKGDESTVINGPGEVKFYGDSSNYADWRPAAGTTLTINAKIADSGSGGLENNGGGVLLVTHPASDYQNGTYITDPGGVLAFTAIANKGVASPMGVGSRLRSSRERTVYRYVGSSSVSTDRDIEISLSPFYLEQAGSGEITFNGKASSVTSGGKTFTLIGSSEVVARYSGVIEDSAGLVHLTKQGSGRWIVDGANTATGVLRVEGGVLELGGSTAFESAIVSGGVLEIYSNTALPLGTEMSLAGGVLRPMVGSFNAERLVVVGAAEVDAVSYGGEMTLPPLVVEAGGVVNILAGASKVLVSGASEGEMRGVLLNGQRAVYSSVNGVVAGGISATVQISAKGPAVLADDATVAYEISSEGSGGGIGVADELTAIWSLTQRYGGSGAVVDLDGKKLAAGMLMVAESGGDLSVGGGTVVGLATAADGGSAEVDAVVLRNDSESAELKIAADFELTPGVALALAKYGVGDVRLSGLTEHGGVTLIDEGRLIFDVAAEQVRVLAGAISGEGELVKSGDGRLDLRESSKGFSGQVVVEGGTLGVGHSDAAGLSSRERTIRVNDGGALDVGIATAGNSVTLLQMIEVEGSGPDGEGAIVNSSTQVDQAYAFQHMTLLGDTLASGVGRTDIRNQSAGYCTLDLAGNRLATAVEKGFGLVNVAVTPNDPARPGVYGGFDVLSGGLWLEVGTTLGGTADNEINIAQGAVVSLYSLANPIVWSINAEEGAVIRASQGVGDTLNRLSGPVNLAGPGATVFGQSVAGAGTYVDGKISGAGGVSVDAGSLKLMNSANDYAGDTVVGGAVSGPTVTAAAKLVLGADEVLPHGSGKGALALAPESSFNDTTFNDATLDLAGRSETVNGLVSGTRAVITDSGSGGRLIFGDSDDDVRYRGVVEGGATLEKRGSGELNLAAAEIRDATIDARGGVVVSGGPNLRPDAVVVLDGADMVITEPIGVHEFWSKTTTATPQMDAELEYRGWQRWPVMGSFASNVSNTTFPDYSQFVYKGRWYLEEGGTYSFAKAFDDGGSLVIDGQQILLHGAYSDLVVERDVELSAGWHTVEVRYSQGGGGVGPRSGHKFWNGILFDAGNGSFVSEEELARASLFAAYGDPDFVADGWENEVLGRIVAAQDATLTVAAGAGNVVLSGVLAGEGGAVPAPVLTIDNSGAPLFIGSRDAVHPAVVDVALNTSSSVVLTNRVWLRQPISGSYTIAPEADIALDGSGILGGPLTLSDHAVRIVRSDSVGGDGSVTVNSGGTVYFDSAWYSDLAVRDSVERVVAYDNAVVLNGGRAVFDGAGVTTYSGAVTGSGEVIKSGSGTAILTGSSSSINGTIRLDNGRLAPVNEAALGGASLHLYGGQLANAPDSDLVLESTYILAETGGFDVDSGRTMTIESEIKGNGGASKWGGGKLIICGSDKNEDFNLFVRSGSVELNKSGSAENYAVFNLGTIAANQSVKLTGNNGNQIGGSVYLEGGTLDLNGRSEVIDALGEHNQGGGLVINNGSEPVVLSVGEGGGSGTLAKAVVRDGEESLALVKVGSGTQEMPLRSALYSGGTTVAEGTLRWSGGVPITDGLVYQLDAMDATQITLDESDRVAVWGDSSGNGYDFEQDSAGIRPHYVVDGINRMPAIRFGVDGSTRIRCDKSASARTLFVVTQVTNPSQGLAGLWGESGQDRGVRQASATSWRHTGNAGDKGDFTFNGGSMFINGSAGFSFSGKNLHVLSAVSPENVEWRTALGNYWNSPTYQSRYFIGEVGEVILYDRELAAAEREIVENYLMNKWMAASSGAYVESANYFEVEVESGATLALSFGSGNLARVTGGGQLQLEETIARVGDYGDFAGRVSGSGMLAIEGSSGEEVNFVPQSVDLTIRNDSSEDTVVRIDHDGELGFAGTIADGSSAFGVVHSGSGLTYFSGFDSSYTGETVIESGRAQLSLLQVARYVRLTPLMVRTGGSHGNSGYQMSEFELVLSGERVEYPAGTTATSPDKGAGGEGPEKAIDNNKDTKFYSQFITLRPLTISMPELVSFDSYRWYTANDATGRDIVKWTVEASLDGVNWSVIDAQDYSENQGEITESRRALVGTWHVISRDQMDVFSDASATTVADPGVLALVGASEVVGALSGDGSIELVAGGVLGVNSFVDTTFSGTVSGEGDLVKYGAGSLTLSGELAYEGELVVDEGLLSLDGATLEGVENITIGEGGVLGGSGSIANSVVLDFAGGGFSGALGIIGDIGTRGTVTILYPPDAVFPYTKTILTYSGADSETLEAFRSAELPQELPRGMKAVLTVTERSVRLSITPSGTLMLLR